MSGKILLLSSSRADGTGYLAHAIEMLRELVQPDSRWLFIPYAGVSISYDQYHQMVMDALPQLQCQIDSAHQLEDPAAVLDKYDGVLVGGGNTFHLLHELYRFNLIEAIQSQCTQGMHYIGWSAGSNVAGLSIRTTNDMPIIEPPQFTALELVPFQLNPHYIDYHPPGHHGETRQQRLEEFTKVAPLTPVIAIQEGSALLINNNRMTLQGHKPGFLFQGATQKQQIEVNADLSQWL
ncbi:dipeptidase PepE [Ferrimonas lipolytica]|uniref:Dipeptidase PepE n=1 Tax=Ferrimonas lipolytica TaxID=2724191 RepID=A0A6H1UE10_9GAMM|nr:dipeptidase PepE [Ferrimonas lipolytica]QIZ76032.1 dipeptidase PepE [Ferrimonas lipolytica]